MHGGNEPKCSNIMKYTLHVALFFPIQTGHRRLEGAYHCCKAKAHVFDCSIMRQPACKHGLHDAQLFDFEIFQKPLKIALFCWGVVENAPQLE